LDGSGKTTQLNLIEKKLRKNFQVRRFHMVAFSIANKILKKKKPKATKSDAQIKAGKWGIFLRKVAIVIDVFRFRFYYLIKTSENKTEYILVDRYFYDQIINIKYLDKKNNWKKEPFWQKIVENQLIVPSAKIYLKIAPTEILKRERDIEQGSEYLLKKSNLYEHFSKNWKLATIDGNQNKKEIQQNINELI
jgi:thymidylate kinase